MGIVGDAGVEAGARTGEPTIAEGGSEGVSWRAGKFGAGKTVRTDLGA